MIKTLKKIRSKIVVAFMILALMVGILCSIPNLPAMQKAGALNVFDMPNPTAPWLNTNRNISMNISGVAQEAAVGEVVSFELPTLYYTDAIGLSELDGGGVIPNELLYHEKYNPKALIKLVTTVRDVSNKVIDYLDEELFDADPQEMNNYVTGYSFVPKRSGGHGVYFEVYTRDVAEVVDPSDAGKKIQNTDWQLAAKSQRLEIKISGDILRMSFPKNQRFIDDVAPANPTNSEKMWRNGNDVFAFFPTEVPQYTNEAPYTFVLPIPSVVDSWGEKQPSLKATIDVILGSDVVFSFDPEANGGAGDVLVKNADRIVATRHEFKQIVYDEHDENPTVIDVVTFSLGLRSIADYKIQYNVLGGVPDTYPVKVSRSDRFRPTMPQKEGDDAGRGEYVHLVADMSGVSAPQDGKFMEKISIPSPRVTNIISDNNYSSPFFIKMEVVYVGLTDGVEYNLNGERARTNGVLTNATDISETQSFTPKEISATLSGLGTYRVYYRAYDCYGNFSTGETPLRITDVFDRTVPSIKMAQNYAVDANGDFVDTYGLGIKDGRHLLPKEVVIAAPNTAGSFNDAPYASVAALAGVDLVRVTFPAIFASDAVNPLSKIQLERRVIWRPSVTGQYLTAVPGQDGMTAPVSTNSNIINVDLLWQQQNKGNSAYTLDSNGYPNIRYNEAITVWIEANTAGTYEVQYRASEEFFNSTTGAVTTRPWTYLTTATTGTDSALKNFVVVKSLATDSNLSSLSIKTYTTDSIKDLGKNWKDFRNAEPNTLAAFKAPSASNNAGEIINVQTMYFFANRSDENTVGSKSPIAALLASRTNTEISNGTVNYYDLLTAINAQGKMNATGTNGTAVGEATNWTRWHTNKSEVPAYNRFGSKYDKDNLYINIPNKQNLGNRDTAYVITFATDYRNQQLYEQKVREGVASTITPIARITVSTQTLFKADVVSGNAIKHTATTANSALNITDMTKIGKAGFFRTDWTVAPGTIEAAWDGSSALAVPTGDINQDHASRWRTRGNADDAFNGYRNMMYNAHQGEFVYLPNVAFATDVAAEYTNIVVSYVNEDGVFEDRLLSSISRPFSAGVQSLTGQFFPSTAGRYVVSFVAEDRSGNISTVNYDVWVRSTQGAIIEPSGSFPTVVELGDTVPLIPEQITVTFNNEQITIPRDNPLTGLLNDGLILEIADDASGEQGINQGFKLNGYMFTGTQEGVFNFILRFDAQDLQGKKLEFSVTVSDTKAPEMEEWALIEFRRQLKENDSIEHISDLVGTVETARPIEIPNIYASKPKEAFNQQVNYTLTIMKGSEQVPYAPITTRLNDPTHPHDGLPNNYSDLKTQHNNLVGGWPSGFWFVPVGGRQLSGTYTITYTAKGAVSGQTLTLKSTLKLGDSDDPVIEFIGHETELDEIDAANKLQGTFRNKGDTKFREGEFKLNNWIKIDLRYIIAKDNTERFAVANAVGKDEDNHDQKLIDDIDYEERFKQVSIQLTKNDVTVEDLNDQKIKTGKDAGWYPDVIWIQIKEEGRYNLTYSVMDAAQNPYYAPFSFTVKTPEGSSSFNTTALGISLTIVALAGIGIIIFFALKEPKNKNKQQQKVAKPKKDDTGKIVV